MATKLIHYLETAFSQTVNSLTGKDFTVAFHDRALPALEDEIVWEQAFSIAAGPSFWLAAGRDLWESLGRLTLIAAGLDETTEEDCRSTWQEIISQTVGGVASRITADVQGEVTASQGQVIGAEPAGDLDWVSFSVADGTGVTWFFKAAWTDELSAAGEPRADEIRSPAVRESAVSKTFDLLLDVALPVSVSFGKTSLQIREVLKLNTGSIVELDRFVTDPVEVIVNDCVIARGEVVVVDGNYGVRISQLASREERLRSGMASTSPKAGARS